MKKTSYFVVILLLLSLVVLVACGSNQETSQSKGGGSEETPPQHVTHTYGQGVVTKEPTYNSNGEKTFTCSCGATKKESIDSLIPTNEVFASGIQTVKNNEIQSYDFSINVDGNISLFGFNGKADANYLGKYRYNSSTNELSFYRRTSGKLLMNADEYICSKDDYRLKIKTKETGEVEKVSIAQNSDDGLNMLNLPFIEMVYALKSNNITEITKNSTGKYKFRTSIKITSSFSPLQKLLTSVGLLGDNISIKNVTFTNPQGGIDLLFNVTDDGVLKDFTLSLDVSFPVSSSNVSINIKYAQEASTTPITLPNISKFISNGNTINQYVNDLNEAIDSVKNSDTYSIDLTAVNDFDAGWNRTAIVDKYIGRMYKNVNDERVDFNHSYKYKAHTEEDGAEGFAFTVGNIQDGSVYEISRKDTNTQTPLENVTASDRFDILVEMIRLTANDISFVSKTTNSDGSVKYQFFTKDSATYSIQQIIADLINSNTADGVIPIENYFNTQEYKIDTSSFTAVIKNGKLVNFGIDIKIKYIPTDGQYTDSRITLKNSIELDINKNIDKATEYVAPKSVTTKIGSIGLNNSQRK
ncbi:MAG: hypothetical protein K5765_00235 [Clostridia bacterium]|nr:hypothetical protein [Clostridia bacterium]